MPAYELVKEEFYSLFLEDWQIVYFLLLKILC